MNYVFIGVMIAFLIGCLVKIKKVVCRQQTNKKALNKFINNAKIWLKKSDEENDIISKLVYINYSAAYIYMIYTFNLKSLPVVDQLRNEIFFKRDLCNNQINFIRYLPITTINKIINN
jgi:hypothetical protein